MINIQRLNLSANLGSHQINLKVKAKIWEKIPVVIGYNKVRMNNVLFKKNSLRPWLNLMYN